MCCSNSYQKDTLLDFLSYFIVTTWNIIFVKLWSWRRVQSTDPQVFEASKSAKLSRWVFALLQLSQQDKPVFTSVRWLCCLLLVRPLMLSSVSLLPVVSILSVLFFRPILSIKMLLVLTAIAALPLRDLKFDWMSKIKAQTRQGKENQRKKSWLYTLYFIVLLTVNDSKNVLGLKH